MTSILLIPGLGGSGPTHWQSRWETLHPKCRTIQECNWNIPEHDAWMDALDSAVLAESEPPVLVAHSLGCALVANWASKRNTATVKAALMVAPADVDERDTIPAEARVFAPMPLGSIPFPTAVVASVNDSFVSLERAMVFATAWGANFHNVGALAHINGDSHLEDWPEGWDMLQDLISEVDVALQA